MQCIPVILILGVAGSSRPLSLFVVVRHTERFVSVAAAVAVQVAVGRLYSAGIPVKFSLAGRIRLGRWSSGAALLGLIHALTLGTFPAPVWPIGRHAGVAAGCIAAGSAYRAVGGFKTADGAR